MKNLQLNAEPFSNPQNIVPPQKILSFENYLSESREANFVKHEKAAAGVAILFDNKILLVHPTNSSWKKGTCGIPKGGVEPGEDLMEAALRELFEETGIRLKPQQLDPAPKTVDVFGKSTNWQLTYFVCKIDDLSEIGLVSEKISVDQLQLEEIDWAKFVPAEEAYPITSRSQLIILDRHLSLNK